MSRSTSSVNESITVAGSSSKAVLERVAIAVRSIEGYALSTPTADQVQFARSSRGLAGRRTHVCTVTAVNEPHRLVITIAGELDREHLTVVRAAITGRSMEDARALEVDSFGPQHSAGASPVTSTPGGFQPPADWIATGGPGLLGPPPGPGAVSTPPEVEQHTVMRPVPAPASPPPAAMPTVRLPVVALSDGRSISLQGTALLGRNPSARNPSEGAALLVPIDDDALSKTHLLLQHDAGRVWVEDRNSTNGSSVLDGLGRSVLLPPGERTSVQLPVTLLIGDTQVWLRWSD